MQVEQSNFVAIDIEKMYEQHQKIQQERNKLKAKQGLTSYLQNQNQQLATVSTKNTLRDLESSTDSATCSDLNDSNLTNFYQNNPISIDGILNRIYAISFPQIFSLLL